MVTKQRVAIQDKQGKLIGSKFLIDGAPVPEGKKYCNACETVLDRSAFSKQGSVCKQCALARARKHHAIKMQDPEWVAKRNKTRKDRTTTRKQFFVDKMGGCCHDCGGVFPLAVYDFHHIDPTVKEHNVGNIMNRKELNVIEEELEKCVLLCSNCHRIRHDEERNK